MEAGDSFKTDLKAPLYSPDGRICQTSIFEVRGMEIMDFTMSNEASSSKSGGPVALQRIVVLPDGSPVDVAWLDQYAAQYQGRRRINRLLFIARSCPQLAPEAYTLAIREIQEQTFDYALYEQVVAKYNALPETSGKQWIVDAAWQDRTRRYVADQQDKLDVELKNYQTNLIKESIRMAQRDIGAFQHKCGDLQAALRTYLKSRDYAASTSQILEICLTIIDVALDTQNYSFVRNYVVKAEAAYDTLFSSGAGAGSASSGHGSAKAVQLPGMASGSGNAAQQRHMDAEDRRKSLMADRIAVAAGIAELGNNNYAKAARKFLNVGPSAKDADANHYISPGDIAIYGTLCALATFDRGAFKRQLVDNANLRPLLELEPHLKEIINNFHENNYKAALDLLQRYEPRHLLDINLAPHAGRLISLIRARAVVQYFAPFSTASLSRMSAAFGWTEDEMQAEVVRLIGNKELKARVDSRNKIVHAYAPSQRVALYKQAIETGENQEAAARALLLRMNLIANDILVKAPKAPKQGAANEDGAPGSPSKGGGSGQQAEQNGIISVE